MQETITRFIEKEINPYVDQWEADGIFPAKELFKKCATAASRSALPLPRSTPRPLLSLSAQQSGPSFRRRYGSLGFLGLTKPVENGGQGLDFTYSVAAAEALGSINCGGVPMAIGVQTDMATPALARFGSAEVRQKFLTPTIAGDMVACLGVSEVSAGSDVALLTTSAVKDGDDYVINGGKMWTTNGSQADWMCCLVNTSAPQSPAEVHTNKTLVCVPMDTPGVSVS